MVEISQKSWKQFKHPKFRYIIPRLTPGITHAPTIRYVSKWKNFNDPFLINDDKRRKRNTTIRTLISLLWRMHFIIIKIIYNKNVLEILRIEINYGRNNLTFDLRFKYFILHQLVQYFFLYRVMKNIRSPGVKMMIKILLAGYNFSTNLIPIFLGIFNW